MKAKLIFNLPEDATDWKRAIQGQESFNTLYDYDDWLRRKIKYEDLTDEQYEVYQSCRNRLRELLYENDINIEKG